MVSNVEVERTAGENTSSLIRRFTKRVQGSGVLSKARGQRFYSRAKSDALKKHQALKSLKRRKEREMLAKLGKLPPKTGRRR